MSILKSKKIRTKAVLLTTLLLAGVSTLGITGCGMGSEATVTDMTGPSLSGRVMGGRQPIAGASLGIWQVGTAGYGSAATLLATTTTDANGNFGTTSHTFSTYTCPSTNNLLYITASGGNPGNSNGDSNSNILLVEALGTCTSATFTATGLNVNEVTTIGAVFALSGFINPATFGASGTTGTTVGTAYTQDAIGTSSTNTTGLTNAFTTVSTLVTAGGSTPGTTSGATVDYQKINTLANILANCVNTDPAVSNTICSTLYSNVGTNSLTGAVPATNTFEAAYYMNTNPTDTVSGTSNISTVYAAVPGTPPYSSALTAQPTDWTVGVNYAVSGLTGGNRIAIDASGDAWVTSTGQVSEVTPAGGVLTLTQSGDATPIVFSSPYGIAVDKVNHVIFTDIGKNDVFVFTTAGVWSQTLAGGTNSEPYGIAIGEGANKLWVIASPTPATGTTAGGNLLASTYGATFGTFVAHTSNFGFGAVHLLIDKDTTQFSPLRYYNSTGSGGTGTVGAIQAFTGAAVASTVSYAGTNTSVFFPTGAVFDSNNGNTGNLWFTNTAYGTIGSTTYGSAATNSFLAKVPVTSSGSATTVDTIPSTVSTTCTGGGLNGAMFMAIDGNSNLWVANSAGNSVSEFLNSCSGTTGAVSPATTGFAHTTSSPTDIATDASGNVWVVNNGAAYVTEIVGAAGPTVVPLVLNSGTLSTSPLMPALWGTKP